MSHFKIRTADEADLSEIGCFIEEHFVTSEPTLQAYQLVSENQLAKSDDVVKDHKDDDDDKFIRECILNGTAFVAHDLKNQFVGICLASKIGPNEHEETLKMANVVNEKKFADMMKFIAFIERKADVCNRLCVPESLHLHIISVHKDYHRNGIAGELFKVCYENAIEKGYLALSLDCTNFYTSKIAEQFNMKLLTTVTYDEYNENAGEIVFFAKEPHTVVRSYGINLNNIRNK